MQATHINVAQTDSGSWLVSQGTRQLAMRAFRLKAHAMAFGRALAFSRGAAMYVYARDGRATQQARQTLTYPIKLD